MKSFNLTEWALNHRAIVLFLILAIGIGGVLGFTKLGQLEDPNFSVPSMTAMVDLAGRDRATDPGRGAQPHGEEVRAARPLREGQDVCAPGLRRHDDHGEGRHLARGSARGLVPGAQEVQRHQARAARRRHRPDLQRRIRRRRPGCSTPSRATASVSAELSDIAEDIKRRLLKVPMVKKVDIYGKQAKKVYVEFSHQRLAALGITPLQIAESLQQPEQRAGQRLRSTRAATACWCA